jgi:tryptophanyl-tRNA synthetase
MHQMFSPPGAVSTVYSECITAGRGCVDCKRELAGSINEFLEPMRERRRQYESRPGYVREILDEGGKRARAIATRTIEEVYEKMGLVRA